MNQAVITADLVAYAIVAAARSFGDCPVKACTSQATGAKRSRTAAALGLARGANISQNRAAQLCRVSGASVSVGLNRKLASFMRAARAAEEVTREKAVIVKPAPAVEPPLVTERLAQLSAAIKARKAEAPKPTAPAPAERPPQGRVVARMQPTFPARREPPEPPSTLRGRILGVLREAHCTAPNLAMLTDAKELDVSVTLKAMEHDGQVVAGPVPEQGTRHRQWRIAKAAAA